MFLTRSELLEMTGYVRPKAQARWLAENQYPFEIGADGYPRVLQSCVEKRLGGAAIEAAASRQRRTEPNFAALV